MKLETFFEKFDQFGDAPNAVAKIRELVLHLAVTGKLVHQNPNAEPASALIGLIEKRKSELVRQGLIPKPPALPSVAHGNLPFSIPAGWQWIRLESVCEIITKGSSPTWQGVQYVDADNGVLFVTSENVGNYVLRKMDEPKFVERKFNEMEPRSILQRDDLLVNLVGGSIGRSAIFDRNDIANINQAVGIIRLVRGEFAIDRWYLLHYLNSPISLQIMFAEQVETARANLSLTNMKHFLVPVPPLAEQKRIVAKVDELMAWCDRLEAQQQERDTRHTQLARASLTRFADAPTPANLDLLFHQSYTIPPADLRKSILTLAVQGKLVPQDPNDEPAADLIARITEMRREKKAKEYESVVADEAPFEIPFSWTWVRLGNLSLTSDSGWSPQCQPEARSGTDWGVLKVSAVSWSVFKPEENKALPPGMTARPDCEVKAGDFLLSRANTEELVARSVIVDQTPPRLMMSDKIVRFTFPAEIERAFINLANTSDPSRAYYARNASGTSNSMKNIGREVMCNLPIPLPPLAEQRRIVAKVDQLMALVDQLETQLAASRATAEKLMEAIVAELTVQV